MWWKIDHFHESCQNSCQSNAKFQKTECFSTTFREINEDSFCYVWCFECLLTSTLHNRSLKPQLPLLEEQHSALRIPSHSALRERQYAVSSAHRIPISFTLKGNHVTCKDCLAHTYTHTRSVVKTRSRTSQGLCGPHTRPWAHCRRSCSGWLDCHWGSCPPWSGWSCVPTGWRWPPSWTQDPTTCWSLMGRCCSRLSFSLWSRTH